MIIQQIHRRSIYLMLIMTFIAIVGVGISIITLYNTAFEEERQRLVETAQSQARLMEAVARHESSQSKEQAFNRTLAQIREAHKHFRGFGETGEFTLAKLENNQIIFLLNHRHDDMEKLRPVPFMAENAEPMRRALQGKSGTVVGLDYRGEMVLAAHEPVQDLGLGIVAKIDLSEIRAPFIRAAEISVGVVLTLIFLGLWAFQSITSPIETGVKSAFKQISGIIPLCAWCGTTIKDDSGDWVKLESYFEAHTNAKVSHGMCPQCAAKMSKEIEY